MRIGFLSAFLLIRICLFAVSQGEYFIDVDPGEGAGLPLMFEPGRMLDFTGQIPLESISAGPHTIGYRLADSLGHWSFTHFQRVYRLPDGMPPGLTTLSRLEYFFDTDPGLGNGINVPISAGADAEATLTLDTSALPVGPHQVHFRFANDRGVWSTLQSKFIYRLPDYTNSDPGIVQRLEYFFDTDPGLGNGINVPISAGADTEVTFTLDTSALPVGPHQVYFRFANDRGVWSTLQSKFIYRLPDYTNSDPGVVQRLEYFFDTDPGLGEGINVPISAGATVEATLTLNTSALSVGPHQVYFRFANDRGVWSTLQSRFIYRLPEIAIPTPSTAELAEYFFDNDPGEGHGFQVTFEQLREQDFIFLATADTLPAGPHAFYIRVRNNRGQWSMLQWKPFFKVSQQIEGIFTPVRAFEWFITGDGGEASQHWQSSDFEPGTTVEAQISATLTTYNENFSGVLHICAVDSLGRRGFRHQIPFTVKRIPGNLQIHPAEDQIEIIWDAVPGAEGYRVYSSGNPRTGFVEDSSGTFSGNVWRVTPSEVRRYFRVTSYNN